MKKLVTLALLITAYITNAQEITQKLSDFTAVKAYDKINVKLVAGPENKIVLKGSNTGDANIVVEKNEVKVKMKTTKLLAGDDITATLYYKTLNKAEAFEGAYISSEDVFKSSNFSVTVKEGAKIKLNLAVDNLKSEVKSGAELELTGTAGMHDMVITSGGIAKVKGLQTGTTTVAVNAGGSASIFATDLADAKTRAGGTIDIYGNPKQVNQKTTAGGTITVRK